MRGKQARPLVVRGGRVIDPSSDVDRVVDVLIADGVVTAVDVQGSFESMDGVDSIDATGMLVTPGFIDLHTHLRTPGEEWKEDFRTGSDAAARGGLRPSARCQTLTLRRITLR